MLCGVKEMATRVCPHTLEEYMMDALTFEQVSLADAKAVLDGPPKRLAAKDWTWSRRPLLPSELMLQDRTLQWMARLPAEVRPIATAQAFARIVNKLCRAWSDTQQCRSYFDDLLLDRRDNRQGFPKEVARELAALHGYYTKHVSPQRANPWDQLAA